MKKTLLLSLLLAGALFVSCKEEEEPATTTPTISVDKIKVEAAAEATTTTLTIISNRSWNIDAGSIDWISFDPSSAEISGKDGDVETVVNISISANSSKSKREANAYIISSDKELDAVKINITQEAKTFVPFEAVIPAPGKFVDPAVFSSLGATHWFEIKTTAKWTAKAASTNTADITLPVSSGEGNVDKFEVKVGPNKDLNAEKVVAVEFTPEGGEPFVLTARQSKGSVLALELRSQDDSTGVWPFTQTPNTETGQNSGVGTLTCGGYSFGYKASTECMFETGYGWRVGRGIGDYIEFPAISGMKLKKVSYADGNTGGIPQLVDLEGTVVKGGRNQDCDALKAAASTDFKTCRDTLVTWTLNGTKGNTAYRLIATANGTMRILSVIAEYVDENTPDDKITAEFKTSFPTAKYVDPTVFSSLGGAPRWISISSTQSWTAKIGAETTAAGVTLTTTSGTGDLDKFEIKCGPNTDMLNRKKIVIEFTVDGMGTQKVEMQQEKGSIMDIECRNVSNTEGFWPFSEDAKGTDAPYTGLGSLTCAGYTFGYFASDACCFESNYGWRVGSTAGDFIVTPAIPGKKLKSIGIADANDKAKSITKNDGTAVEFTQSPEAIVKKEITTYTITSPEENTPYRLVITAKGTIRMYFVRLVYE